MADRKQTPAEAWADIKAAVDREFLISQRCEAVILWVTRIPLWWKQTRYRPNPCKHHTGTQILFGSELGPDDFQILEKKCLGVDLSWVGRPVPVFQSRCLCNLCGAEFMGSIGYSPFDRVERNAAGWPIDEFGNKLPVAKYVR